MKRFPKLVMLSSLLAISACISAVSPAQSVKPPVKVASCDRSCPPHPTGIPDACYVGTFEALKVSLQTPRKGVRSLTPPLFPLVWFAYSTNDNAKTFELINVLPTETEKADAISEIIDIHHPTGTPAQRADFLSRAGQLVVTFKAPEPKTRSLISLAEQYIRLKQPEPAITLLTLAQQSLPAIKDVEQQNTQRVKAAANLAALNQLDPAMRMVSLITTADRKAEALEQIAIKLAQSGQFQPALEIVNRLQSPEAKSSALVTIADQYIEINDQPKALAVLAQAFQVAQLIKEDDDNNGENKASALKAIAVSYAQAGDDRQAFEVARTIAPDRRASEISELSDYYLQQQRYDQVMQVIQVMREVKDDFWVETTLTNLAHRYVETGKYDQAVQIANSFTTNRSERERTGIIFSSPESRSGKFGILTHLATQYAKTGDKPKAVDLFNQILAAAQKTATATELVEIAVTYQATIGDRPRSITLLDQALKLAKSSHTDLQDFILGIVADGYGQLKQYDQAAKVIKLIRQSQPNEADSFHDSLGSTLSTIASSAADDGQFQQALKFANMIRSPEEKDDMLKQLAIRVGEAKHYDQALQIAKLVRDRPERDRLIQTIQCAQSKQ
jgi:tetratricopeptide (TPR) repeat protein